ncbi:TetR/AcrR family transcriptional regulator [Wenyingzhuangia aestuarii]|uniref:TetR/AcrR family transcriptional regulator n=1 Tax=Wenyingzhuangia aestuarii TaxID=1647582 RepID=UPI00143962E5|nr:TetR/AcrR family transcriptional regulator [Wenyingzhuangia aestuarii]NJB82617.1 AcrR family transcriptional regulator [Wenyingzhuangia aestuarii]
MRPQKVENTELIQRLFTVLRTKGYEGASLNDLAAASGLQKASLYHRFPGGKKDIALAVLNHVGEWTHNNLIQVVQNTAISHHQKLEILLTNIDELYNSGKSACITQTLSMENSGDLFSENINKGTNIWINCFIKLAIEFGKNTAEANDIAYEVIVQIQGSLILCKSIQTTQPFKNALNRIRTLYTS